MQQIYMADIGDHHDWRTRKQQEYTLGNPTK